MKYGIHKKPLYSSAFSINMARTRSADKLVAAGGKDTDRNTKSAKHVETADKGQKRKKAGPKSLSKDETKKEDAKDSIDDDKSEPKPAKKKQKQEAEPGTDNRISTATLQKIIDKYGNAPLSTYENISDADKPTAATILAHVLHAMLTSARISHAIASRSVQALLTNNYHDIKTLSSSSWERRTEVLTEGGYTRYREKTATGLDDLADFVQDRYDGDLNNLRKEANDMPEQIRAKFKEIKGLGDVGVSILCDSLQGLWPCLAPFVDSRSLATADKLGLPSDAAALFDGVEKDPMKMARLCTALTSVRLDKKGKEFA